MTGAWQPLVLSLLSGDTYRGTASATKFAGAVSPLSRNLGALGFLASIYLCNPARCPQGWGSPFLFRTSFNITAIWSSLTGLTRHFPGSRSSFLRFFLGGRKLECFSILRCSVQSGKCAPFTVATELPWYWYDANVLPGYKLIRPCLLAGFYRWIHSALFNTLCIHDKVLVGMV